MADKSKPTFKGNTVDGKPSPLHKLSGEVAELQKTVKGLKDILNVHDNWHSETRDLVGKQVTIRIVTGEIETGQLLWTDRYNVCALVSGKRRVYTKGGIVYIEPQS